MTPYLVSSLLYGIQCLLGKPFLYTDTGEYTEALRLDVDLTFATFLGTYLVAVSIVSTNEPVAVPAILQDRIVHCLYFLACAGSFISITHQLTQLGIFFAVFTNIPAMNTDSATGPSLGPKVWKDSPG